MNPMGWLGSENGGCNVQRVGSVTERIWLFRSRSGGYAQEAVSFTA